MDVQDAGKADRGLAPGGSDTLDGRPPVEVGKTQGDDRLFCERDGGLSETSASPPQ